MPPQRSLPETEARHIAAAGPVGEADQTVVLPRQHDPVDWPANTAAGPAGGHDQTVVLPMQRIPADAPAPKVSAWEADPTPRGIAPVEGVPHGRERALGTLAWMFSALVTAGLAMVRLNWASMRTPELSAWRFTGVPWRQVPVVMRELAPGSIPYDVLLHAWASAFGRSDFALRMPSVLAMAAAAAMVSVVGTRVGGPRVGVLAGLLMSALPITTRYAQEAGPQALVAFAAALATLALLAVLDRPRPAPFIGYAAAVALLGLGHVTGLTVVVAHGLIVLMMRRRVLPGWLFAALLGTAPTVALMAYADTWPWAVPARAVTAGAPSIGQLTREAFGTAVVGGAVIGLAMLAVSLRKPAVVFSSWVVVPLLLLYPVMHFTAFTLDHLAVASLPGWAGLGALALSRAPVVRGMAGLLVIAAIGVPDQVRIRHPDGHGEASHRLAEMIYERAQPGDGIVFGPPDADGPAGRAVVERYLSAGRRPKDLLAQPGSAGAGGMRVRECPDVDACLGKAGRIWLVRVGSLDSPLTNLEAGKDGALRVRYHAEGNWKLTGLTLTLYTLKQAS
jgi:mannosyltransferase